MCPAQDVEVVQVHKMKQEIPVQIFLHDLRAVIVNERLACFGDLQVGHVSRNEMK